MDSPSKDGQRAFSLPKISQQLKQNRIIAESEEYSLYDPNQEQNNQLYNTSYNSRYQSRNNSASKGSLSYQQNNTNRSLSIENSVPGPGTYAPNYDSVFRQSSKPSMTKSPRELKHYEKRPGPGYYEPSEADKYCRKRDGVHRFSLDKRRLITIQNDYDIGPGQYTIDLNNSLNNSMSQTKSVSFTKSDRKLIKSPISYEPGPGYYNPQKLKEARNTLFTQSRIDDSTSLFTPLPFEIPGVGSYTISQDEFKYSPKTVFSSDKRFQVNDKQTPAPNSYNIPSKFDQYIKNDTSYNQSQQNYQSGDKIRVDTLRINEKQNIFQIKNVKLRPKKQIFLPNNYKY